MKTLVLSVVALVALSGPVSGQRVEQTSMAARRLQADVTPHANAVRSDSVVRTGAMAVSGVMMGALGAVGGGFVGYSLRTCSDQEWFCGVGEMFVGALVGEVIMLSYGVHTNGKRTTLGRKIGMASLIALGGLALAPVTDGGSMFAVPPLQLLALISAEQSGAAQTKQ